MVELDLAYAARLIGAGECVAFPTETVYGLGANAYCADAVARIYAIKGRPADNPLIVHIHDFAQLDEVAADVPDIARRLARHFWGGPLTLVLKRHGRVPGIVSAGLDTVAVRMPSHPVANAFLRACGLPVAAPSANLSGRPSPTTAAHVAADLGDRVPLILDGGACRFGIESTVLDLTAPVPAILRPGVITLGDLAPFLPAVAEGGAEVRSPGQKYRHYAPRGVLRLVSDPAGLADLPRGVGIMALNAKPEDYPGAVVLDAGRDSADYAARLYYMLREFDARGTEVIYAGMPGNDALGASVLNRLEKAMEN